MATAIVATQLARAFEGTPAVAGIDLEIPAGEIYGFLGPNGAGKSTTVRMLCTLLRPTSGTATVAGFDVVRDPGAVRLRIGVALQDAALDPQQTGEEILRLQGRLCGLSRSEIRERMETLRSLVVLGDALAKPVRTYSGGMKRRLDLAAALIHNPEVLFLDEPTTGLDPVSRVRVWDEVRSLNRELGTTIFLTTQYLEEADALAHRVGIIDRGCIVAEGTPVELKRAIGADVIVVEVAADDDAERAEAAVVVLQGIEHVDRRGREVLLRTSNGPASLSPVAVALDAANVAVQNLSLRTPTLDDVFLELTGARMEGTVA